MESPSTSQNENRPQETLIFTTDFQNLQSLSGSEKANPNIGSGRQGTQSNLNSLNPHQVPFAHMKYTNTMFQRQILEIKNALQTVNQKTEAVNRECIVNKNSTAKLEAKQGLLEKMIASHTDKLLNINRDMTAFENSIKSGVQETTTTVDQLKRKVTDLERRVVELKRKAQSGNFGASNTSGVPPGADSLGQLVEDVELQLALYDVRIAEMGLRLQALECTSYKGTMIWKIKDYQRRKREAISGRVLWIDSQPFYTSRNGYKMCARIYLNGDGRGKGTHMSLFFIVMQGEYDTRLQWPFRQKVDLILKDQGQNPCPLSASFQSRFVHTPFFDKPTSDMNIPYGCPLFVAQSVVDGSSYSEDGAIYIKIQVDVSDL